MGSKYSLIYLTTGCCSPAQMLRIASKTGYHCIGARTIPMGLKGERTYDLAGDHQLLRETKEAMEETGITIDSIENARIHDGMKLESYEPFLEAAAKLGVRHVLSNIWSSDKSYYTDRFGALCDLAASYGQTIDLEFVTWSSVRDLRESRALLEAVNRPNTSILVDTLHFHRSQIALSELEQIPKEWLYCIHLCDAPPEIPKNPEALAQTAREGRLYPGEGGIDIRSIAACMPNAVRGIEIPNRSRWDLLGYEAYAREALQRTREYLEETERGGLI